jgi:predicted glycosyltransferase
MFLVDHMPHGAMGELLPTLWTLKAAGAKIVLGLRDILDAPEVVRQRWQSEGAYEAIERFYDLVLVYGRRDVFDLAEQYHFPPTVLDRLRYCGYVCTPAVARSARGVRATYLAGADADAKLIAAMAGGGADAYPMMRALLDAFPSIQSRQRCAAVVVAGPFMPRELYNDLKTRAAGLPVRVLRAVTDTLSLIAAADLVVGMAGYNTTMEILRSGRQALVIPRAGPSAEQRMRARLFAAKGWIGMLDPDDLSADRLAQAVVDNLAVAPASASDEKPDLQGLARAAEELLALLPATSADIPDRAMDTAQPSHVAHV